MTIFQMSCVAALLVLALALITKSVKVAGMAEKVMEAAVVVNVLAEIKLYVLGSFYPIQSNNSSYSKICSSVCINVNTVECRAISPSSHKRFCISWTV